MSLVTSYPNSSEQPGSPGDRRPHFGTMSLRRARSAPLATGRAVDARPVPSVVTVRSRGPSGQEVPAKVPTAVPTVSVIIPTFNEAKNLPYVFSRLPADLHEVIVVDGHSVDGTDEVARACRPDVRIIHQNRKGKGNAMACGFSAATGDIVVMLDADGSADPDEIPRFVEALVDGSDFAKGSRFAQGGGSADITRTRAWGNRCLNLLANVLFGTEYTDLCYGYNACWRRCLVDLDLDPRPQLAGGRLWGDGFEIETIINTRIAKAHLVIAEVPSFEHRRVHGETNLNTWRDGSRVLWALVVERCNGKGRRRSARPAVDRDVVVRSDGHLPVPPPEDAPPALTG